MQFKKFICGECGLIEDTSKLKQLLIDAENKVPDNAKGIAKILVRNKYSTYACPECSSFSIFYAEDEPVSVKTIIQKDAGEPLQQKSVPIEEIQGDVKQVSKRGRKKLNKKIIENLGVLTTTQDINIESELNAFADLAKQSGIEFNMEKAKSAIKNMIDQRQTRQYRPPAQPLNCKCDMCKQSFQSKYEATRCPSCIGRTSIRR